MIDSKIEIINIVLLFVLIVIVAINVIRKPPDDHLYLIISVGTIISYLITIFRCYDNYNMTNKPI